MMDAHSGFISISEPAVLSQIIASIEGTKHAFALPLYRAALAGELRAIRIVAGGRVPARLLDHECQATVITIAGDPGPATPTPTPAEFPQARRLLIWAGAVMLHAAGGAEAHYVALVQASRLLRRVLLIETAPDQQDPWMNLIEDERRRCTGRQLPVVVITPQAPVR